MTAASVIYGPGSVADVVALATESADPRQVYRAAERLAAETIGWRLFTVLRYVEPAQAVERLYSSDEAAYPVGGRKPLSKITAATAPWSRAKCSWRQRRRSAPGVLDHELIFSLGITAILNVPIRHAARRLGTVNLCGEEGMYGPRRDRPRKVLAGLLAPTLLAWVSPCADHERRGKGSDPLSRLTRPVLRHADGAL